MNKENEPCVPAEDQSVTIVDSAPTATGASVPNEDAAYEAFFAPYPEEAAKARTFEVSRNWCMNCTAIHAPYRARDKNNNEVPVCRNCFNKLRIMEEYPKANRINRRLILKQLKKEKKVL